MASKTVLRVVMLDTWRTHCAHVHENDHVPYGRRLVSIELTPEQLAMIEPRKLGVDCGQDRHEEVGEVWLEDVEATDGN